MTRSFGLRLLTTAAIVCACADVSAASAAEGRKIGVTMGSLGNPYFVALTKGISDQLKETDPSASVASVSADYDLNKQFNQIDNFIAAGVKLIILNAVDPRAVQPAIKRAQAAGAVVIAADVAAAGADATVMTDNVAAGRIACDALVSEIGGKGEVVIENGPQVSSIIDRVHGCHEVLDKHPEIKVLSQDQDGKGSRDGGMAAMQGYAVRYPTLQGVFTVNDPQAIGSELAARQSHRDVVITSVDGAPDVISSMKAGGMIKATASQDPYTMGKLAVQVGYDIINGKKPDQPIRLMSPQLVTQKNVADYRGWTDH